MDMKHLISVDNDILGGQPVFAGTRVPVETLFDHLGAGVILDAFLDDFPSVTKEQAIGVLETAHKLLSPKNNEQFYPVVA